MKNFIEWFKNRTKIKRWMFIIIIGMILVCYGFSRIFVLQRLGVKELLEIIISFAIGFVLFIIGLIHIQRRALELVIEANSMSKGQDKEGIKLKTLVSKKNIYEKGPKIVVIGGGTGLNKLLQGLKRYTSNITAIVSVSSYGLEQPNSIKELNLKPIEDIKQGIIALSLKNEEMSRLMNHKFLNDKLEDLSFGDVYLSAMQEIYGDLANSVEKSSDILAIVGKVLPVTLDEMNICAELEDGTVVEEKDRIAEIVTEKVTKVSRVYLSPANCRVAPGVLEAIQEADSIVIGPGSIYTNVIPNLLIKNVSKAIKESKAQKVYISNIMTEPGQTDDYDVSNHIQAIIDHSSEGVIDYCISDVGEIVPEFIRKYNLAGANVVNIDTSNIKEKGIKLIKGEFATIDGEYIRHNPDEIAKKIIELIHDELKFKDKQKDEQYVLLQTKLNEENKKKKAINKVGKRVKDKNTYKGNRIKKTSKFNSKYKERIEAIKDSEKTRQENIKIHEKAEMLINREEQKEKEKFLEETYMVKEENNKEG